MVSYTQKDVRIKVDGADLFCKSADIKYDAGISPQYNTRSTNAYEFRASQPPRGSFSLNYFLTGLDPLHDKAYNERVPVSLSFNGLTINSGYLTSYAFNADPHAAAEIKADFDFYEKVGGTFAADDNFALSDVPPLTVSDMRLNNGTVIKSNNIKNINYTYKASIQPCYAIEENFDMAGANIEGVTSSEKRVDLTFGLYDYDLSLPVTGLNESFEINFKDKNSVSKQVYYIDGQINNKSMSAQIGARISTDYSLSQAFLGAKSMTFRSAAPSAGDVGSSVQIQVDNMSSMNDVSEVLIGDYHAEIDRSSFSYDSSTSIGTFNIIVSTDMLSGYRGPVGVYHQGGYQIGKAGGGLSFFETTNGLTTF